MIINQVSENIENFQFNKSVAKIYEIVNHLSKGSDNQAATKQGLEILIRVIEPMMPHLAEECWSLTGKTNSITNEPWPEVNTKYLEKKIFG